ncbi:MAG: hypothetical protein RB191_02120 [Terriglobia bacterium]|nr:hypothetical protein [Terriglobia bacterium]
MDKKLEKAKAALKARQTSFPVLVLDGGKETPDAEFSATLYGSDFLPVSPETTGLSRAQISAGKHFMHRMRTRAEFEAEKARS